MATIQHIVPDAIQKLITCYDTIGYDDGKNESIYEEVKILTVV